ncbi:MAG: efflux RND transporter periplasmic adaptor subunit [Bacteroidota bacterium]
MKLSDILLLGTALLSWQCGNTPSSGQQQQRRPVVLVEVETARRARIVETISATGTITAKNEVQIIAQTEGKIVLLDVEEGSRVKAGEVVVRLDATVLAAQTKEAEATTDDARANFERAKRLYESKLVSEQEFDQARTRYNVAQARSEYQKALLKYTTIASPISGVVTFRGAREGDIAVPRQLLLTISDPVTLVMEVPVSELQIPRVRVNDPVKITVDAYPLVKFAGKVRRVFPASDPVSRLVKVEVMFTERDDRLMPGMFGRAELTTSAKDSAVVLSNDAVMTSSIGVATAYVVVDSVVERRELTLGIREAARIEILDGVKAGDKVVVVGQNALNDRMQVQITKERSYGEEARSPRP